MEADIKVGPERSEIMEKYTEIFEAFPPKTKFLIAIKIVFLMIATQILRPLYKLNLLAEPKIDTDVEVDLTSSALRNNKEGLYLTESEIEFFNKNGFIRPFKVIDRDKALKLNDVIREKVSKGNIVYGVFPDMDYEERNRKLTAVGLRDDIESRSWNRHFNIEEIYDLLARPEITQRLASLFGKDVYLWRSQLFPVPSKGKGTALHQVTDFRFAMNKTVLAPKEDTPKSLINLTTWIALTDVDESNGAMVLMRGSHKTNKFEQYVINAKYYVTRANLFERLLIFFVRNVANDGHARFDIANIFIDIVKKIDSEVLDKSKLETMRMKAGEAIIFTSRTIHGSHGNNSETERLALGGRYTSSSVQVYPDSGEYKEINHFKPVDPVILDKYKKIFKVWSVD